MDRVTEQYFKNIQVHLPVRVVNVYENSLVDVEPLIYADIPMPIINRVPIQHLGASSEKCIKFKIEKNQDGLILLSQIDFSRYMDTGEKSKSDTDEVFNLTNAVFVPYLQWKNGGVASAISDMEVTMPLTSWKGNINLVGDLSVDGAITCTGGISASGEITSEIDVNGGGISLKNHTHGGVTTGGGSTGIPE